MLDQNRIYYDIAIIGSGPAGLTAGIYAGRSAHSCCIVAGSLPFGQLMNTTEVENYPGFPDGIQGPELMQKMHDQMLKFDVQFYHTYVSSVVREDDIFILHIQDKTIHAKAVILATGAEARWLNIDNEDKFKGRGVSTCATCDGFFYKGNKVAVVGGGDTAAEEAIYLSGIAKHVHFIHRRDKLRASDIMQKKLYAKANITFHLNEHIVEYLGDDHGLCGVALENIDGERRELKVDGVFLGIGHDPQTALVKDLLRLDEHGYVISDGVFTNIPGFFVAGDVFDMQYRQAITAAGSGCQAGMSAIRFLDDIQSMNQ